MNLKVLAANYKYGVTSVKLRQDNLAEGVHARRQDAISTWTSRRSDRPTAQSIVGNW